MFLNIKKKEKNKKVFKYYCLLDNFFDFTKAQSFFVISLGATGLSPKTSSTVSVRPLKFMQYPPNAFLTAKYITLFYWWLPAYKQNNSYITYIIYEKLHFFADIFNSFANCGSCC
jgi:hypothetical protein